MGDPIPDVSLEIPGNSAPAGGAPAGNTPPAATPPADGDPSTNPLIQAARRALAKQTPAVPDGDAGSTDIQTTRQRPPAMAPEGAAPNTPPADTDPRALNLGKMREKYEAELAAAKTEIATKDAEAKAALERARAAEQLAAKHEIRDTLTYREQFEVPAAQARSRMTEALTRAGRKPEDWTAAVNAGTAEVQKFLAALESEGKKGEATELLLSTQTLVAIDHKAKSFVDEHQVKMDELRAAEGKKVLETKEAMVAHRKANTDKVLTDIRDKEPFGVFLKPIAGQEAWNNQVARLAADAQRVIDSNDFHLQAKAAFAAQLVPPLMRQVEAYRTELHALRTKIAELTGAVGAGAGTGGGMSSGYVPPARQPAAPGEGGWAQDMKAVSAAAVRIAQGAPK